MPFFFRLPAGVTLLAALLLVAAPTAGCQTPDAPSSSAATDTGNVYTQKPLTWSVGEARYLRRLAAETDVDDGLESTTEPDESETDDGPVTIRVDDEGDDDHAEHDTSDEHAEHDADDDHDDDTKDGERGEGDHDDEHAD